MKRPTTEQIDTAVAWLRSNEGDQGESERCAAVADWIEHLEQNASLAAAARKGGVSVKALRARLRRTS
jgi:hypothetical protein